jgi:hypothetical protein
LGPHDKVNNVEADLRVGPEVTVTR